MQKAGQAMRDADEFTFALQKAYPQVPVYRDPLSPKTNYLVTSLNRFVVSGPGDVTAVVAEQSFASRPKDYNLIQDMEHELEAAHIKVVRFRPGFHLPSSPGKG